MDERQRHDDVVVDESRCPACEEPWRDEQESSRPVCGRCDDRLDLEIGAYLAFVAICRA